VAKQACFLGHIDFHRYQIGAGVAPNEIEPQHLISGLNSSLLEMRKRIASMCRSLDFLRSSQLTLRAEPATLSTATARRLMEIARRNEIHREAKLPLLPIAKELRRIKRREELEEFGRLEAAYGRVVWEEVLKPRREAEGPNSTKLDGERQLSERG
jgi:hypothetical protein